MAVFARLFDMFRWLVLVGLMVGVALASDTSSLLPLQTGNTWTLDEYISDTDPTVLNQSVMRVSTTKVVNGTSTYQVTGLPGAKGRTVYLTSDANGIRWHGFQDADKGLDLTIQDMTPITLVGADVGPYTVPSSTALAGSVRLDIPAYASLINLNGNYQANVSLGQAESVTVPAGTFLARPVEFVIDDVISSTVTVKKNSHGKLWLADGVGIVKAMDLTNNSQVRYFRLAHTNVVQTGSASTSTTVTTTTTTTTFTSIPISTTPQISAGRFHSLALDRSGVLSMWGADNFGQLGLGREMIRTTPGRLNQVGSYVTTSAGGGTSYAIDAAGNLWSWGLNDVGQLGDGTLISRSTPVKVGGDFKAVAAGYYHVLAIKNDDTLWAWGYNAFGALGDGTQTNSRTPKQIGTGRYKAIAASNLHSLAVALDGSLWAWGGNQFGQLGDGTTTEQHIPLKVISGGVQSVAAGYAHSIALASDGSVWTWGQQFGGTTRTKALGGIVAIAAGGLHNLALKTNGDLWAWGSNNFGQIGNGGKVQEYLPPTLIGSNFASIAAGIDFSAAVTNEGQLWTWGQNVMGQLGIGNQAIALAPVLVGEGYSHVAAGQLHVLAVRTDASLWGWGFGANGELASSMGDGLLRSTPIEVGTGFTKAQAGGDHTLAIKADGTLWTWGYNQYGQLGDSTYAHRSSPVKVGDGYVEVAGGLKHSLAIKADGSLWAWGYNGNGQVGIGQMGNPVPAPILLRTEMKAVAAGNGHSLGLATDGKLWAWGDNSQGQLGLGNTTSQTKPTLVGGDYVDIAAGDDHSMALKADGSLWAWGSNQAGQVGDGSTTMRTSPFKVGGNFVAIGKARWASFGIKDDGSVWTWGKKQTENFADTDFSYASAPVPVDIQGVRNVTGGGAHNLFLRTDGRIFASGYNLSGQLGDGTFASRISLGAVVNPQANDLLDIDPQAPNDPIPLDVQVPFFVKSEMNTFVETTINLDDSAQNKEVAFGGTGWLRPDSSVIGSGGPLASNDAPLPNKKIQSVAPLVPVVLTSQGWKLQSATSTDMEARDVSTQASSKTLTLYETRLFDPRNEEGILCVGYSAGAGTSSAKGLFRAIVTGTNASLTCPPLRLAAPTTTSTSTSSTTSTTSTTTTSTTTTTMPPAITANLMIGWNLVGNGVESALGVVNTLGDANKVQTVWKWVVSGTTPNLGYPAWAFYSPALPDGGKAYAASKGYDALTTIQAGEGFWVNAKAGFALTLPAGAAVTSTSFAPDTGIHALVKGWNLIATGDKPTPLAFHQATGSLPINFTTLWAWDATKSGWYFWAPALANNGGLAAYLTQKGYLDFTTLSNAPPGSLSPTTGFWVNRP